MAVPAWIQEVGTAGSLIAAFGIGAVVSARIARSSVISGFRQKWIDDLRQDIVDILSIAEQIGFNSDYLKQHGKLPEAYDQHEYAEKISRAIALVNRVRLRLNPTESDHVRLLKSLEVIGGAHEVDASTRIATILIVLEAARTVLKREWDVTKYGYWMRPVLRIKRTWWARWLLMTDLAPPGASP